ncbi:MAG: digeranylgeranylglycerophospholipid reductase [Halobacteriales archaeon]|jgi:digeranylgeranylglycerophospholipid reductase
MATDTHDVVVVGGGTAGCFAAATAAREGLDVVLLERKPAAEAGHIACGDAIKGATAFPDVIDREYLRAEAVSNGNVERAVFENPVSGDSLEVSFGDESGVVLDRKRYGEVLLEEVGRLGARTRYDTVVNDVVQDDDGRVTGVRTVRNGDARTVEAEVVIDAAGSLSILQDRADFSDATVDTDVSYRQFCSAYREIVTVEEPVPWDDAIVFRPAEELGYLWYFPRTPTEINVGVGFQMTEDPMTLVEVLRNDLRERDEFRGARVEDKLGAALPTRRPYDSAVAPGYVAAGDAAGHVNPTTGGGIAGAAKAGTWAAEVAVEAVGDGTVDETALWEYNRRVMTDFGKRFAAMDLYNVFGTAHDVDELAAVVAAMPGQQLVDAVGRRGTADMGLRLKVETLLRTWGHWGLLYELYRVHRKAEELKAVYDDYPTTPAGFEDWRADRDAVVRDVYGIAGAEPKY